LSAVSSSDGGVVRAGRALASPPEHVHLLVDSSLSVLARKLRMIGVDTAVAGEVLRSQQPGMMLSPPAGSGEALDPGDIRGARRLVGLLRVGIEPKAVEGHMRCAAIDGRLALDGSAVLGLRGRGYSGEIALTLVEPEPRALTRGVALLRRCVDGLGLGPVTVQGLRGDLRAGPGEFDLVVLGAVLVEVGHGQAEAARVELLRQLLRGILAQNVGGDGLLLVVEPALKVTSRRLQQVREALRAEAGLFVVAPCPHAEACPLLTRAEDWCHEDLAVDLPAALVPIARAAGLRWQGLTYSRLALSTSPVRRPGARRPRAEPQRR
jgi:hypothetical protein